MNIKKSFVIFLTSVLLTIVNLQALANSKANEVIDDSIITTKIKAKLLADKRLSSLNVSITTTDGIVWIDGNVPTEKEAGFVVEIAASTHGVLDVDTTNLKVQDTNHTLLDAYTTAKIKGIYIREKVFGDKDIPISKIHIETKNGIVYLTGKVDNNEEKGNAEKLAKIVKGVKKVESKLTLAHPSSS